MNISVIILVWNKAYEMSLILEAFKIQTIKKSDFEIIIVDDGSEDHLEQIIKNSENELDINYIKMQHTGNRAGNRDIGVELTQYESILFLDGDIIPAPNFIEFHMKHCSDTTNIISMGLRNQMHAFNQDLISVNTIRHNFEIIAQQPAYSDERNLALSALKEFGLSINDKWFITYSNNLCINKDFYMKIGGFDENFSKGWGAEDVELGYRALQNGGRIKLIEEVICYHIHHKDDWKNKRIQLKKNVDYFFSKYLDWETELFTIEHMVWPYEYIVIREKIKLESHLLKILNFNPVEEFDFLPENVINFGITDSRIFDLAQIKTHLCINKNEKHSSPLLGIKTTFKNEEFEVSLISVNYKNINKSFFELVINEAKRISKKILLVDKDGIIDTNKNLPLEIDFKNKYAIPNCRPKIRFIMTINNINININLFYFDLAILLKTNNYNVSIDISGDYKNETFSFDSLFINFDDESKQKMILEMLDNNLNYFDWEIPVILDNPLIGGNAVRGVNNKYYWGDIPYLNYEHVMEKEEEDEFDNYLFRQVKNIGELDVIKPKSLLPIGINGNKSLESNISNICKFLIILPNLEKTNQLVPIIKAFKSTFENDLQFELSIFCGNIDLSINDLPLSKVEDAHNDSVIEYINDMLKMDKLYKSSLLSDINEEIAGQNNIILYNDKFNETHLNNQIEECNYFIDYNTNKSFNYFLVKAAGLGKKILTNNYDQYEDIIPDSSFIKVKSEIKNGINSGIPMELIWYTRRDERRHTLIKLYDYENLKHNFNNILKGEIDHTINKKDYSQFLHKFSQQNQLNAFKDIYKKFNEREL